MSKWIKRLLAAAASGGLVPAGAVALWDERLSTVEARRVLRASGMSIEKRARAVDRLSAVLILQSYLDAAS
jgi:putative Holliday junction resolvase